MAGTLNEYTSTSCTLNCLMKYFFEKIGYPNQFENETALLEAKSLSQMTLNTTAD